MPFRLPSDNSSHFPFQQRSLTAQIPRKHSELSRCLASPPLMPFVSAICMRHGSYPRDSAIAVHALDIGEGLCMLIEEVRVDGCHSPNLLWIPDLSARETSTPTILKILTGGFILARCSGDLRPVAKWGVKSPATRCNLTEIFYSNSAPRVPTRQFRIWKISPRFRSATPMQCHIGVVLHPMFALPALGVFRRRIGVIGESTGWGHRIQHRKRRQQCCPLPGCSLISLPFRG